MSDIGLPVMPGPDSMFMYDPTTFGTPLTLLQIPPQAIADVQSKLSDPSATIAHYTQDCHALSDLKHMVGHTDITVARESTVDVGFICKKCHMVYPGRDACVSHQQTLCYQSKALDVSKTILKLEQIQYKCGACKEKLSTLAEYKVHCNNETHRTTAAKYLAQKQAAKAAASAAVTAANLTAISASPVAVHCAMPTLTTPALSESQGPHQGRSSTPTKTSSSEALLTTDSELDSQTEACSDCPAPDQVPVSCCPQTDHIDNTARTAENGDSDQTGSLAMSDDKLQD